MFMGLNIQIRDRLFLYWKGFRKQSFFSCPPKIKKGIKDPKFDIINSLRKVGGPEIDIIRHGLCESEALLLEPH